MFGINHWNNYNCKVNKNREIVLMHQITYRSILLGTEGKNFGDKMSWVDCMDAI